MGISPTLQLRRVEETKRKLFRKLYKQSFFEFFKQAVKVLEPSTPWDFTPFHFKYLCDLMQSEVERIRKHQKRKTHYVINLPYRSGKSYLFTIVFPLWCWLVFPECQLLTLAYSEGVAEGDSTKTLIILESEWFKYYFPDIVLTKTENSKSKYRNTKQGVRIAAGATGSVLSKGGDIVIVDDPNNRTTKTELDETIKNFDDVISNRLNNPATSVIIVIQQRVHTNDLSSYILKKYPDTYKHICIPAILSDDVSPVELKELYVDGLFWPTRWNRDILDEYKKGKTLQFASRMMQRPTLVEGGTIKKAWFDVVDTVPAGISWNLFIDTAYTKSKLNDPSAILVAGIGSDNIIYIKNCYQVWYEFPELVSLIKTVAKDTGASCRIYIEPKASGKSIVQELRASTMLNVIELTPPKGDKQSRVNATTPKLESRRVKLVKGDYIETFLEEVTSFPLSSHDDQTDVLVYAVEKLIGIQNSLEWVM